MLNRDEFTTEAPDTRCIHQPAVWPSLGNSRGAIDCLTCAWSFLGAVVKGNYGVIQIIHRYEDQNPRRQWAAETFLADRVESVIGFGESPAEAVTELAKSLSS